MNIILIEPEEIVDHCVTLTDRRAKHIVKVLGSEVGDSLRVGVINGLQGTGEVLAVHNKQSYRVELAIELAKGSNRQSCIDLLLALPRPIMLKRIFSQTAALGVGRFYLIHARRVEKSYWSGSIIEEEQYRFHLLQGLEQAMDTSLPEVEFHRRFKPFVEDVLPTIKNRYSHLLLAHPGAVSSLLEMMIEKPVKKVLLAVGPEGGWIDYEIDKLKGQGFTPFTIGDRILKVDTAVIALHSRISLAKELLK